MEKKTGYMIQMVATEWNDENYYVSESGKDFTAVYPSRDAAIEGAKEAVYTLAMTDPYIGSYCDFVDGSSRKKLIERFPDIFNEYGQVRCSKDMLWSGGFKSEYVKVTEDAAMFIADNFELFTIQEVTVYE